MFVFLLKMADLKMKPASLLKMGLTANEEGKNEGKKDKNIFRPDCINSVDRFNLFCAYDGGSSDHHVGSHLEASGLFPGNN